MKIGFLDCFAGMSSSRFVAALISAGVPEQLFHDTVDALDVGARLNLTRVSRNSISTIKAVISLNEENFKSEKDFKQHDYPFTVQMQQNHKPAQRLGTIEALINDTFLAPNIKAMIIQTFTFLAQAEAKVRGLPLEEISFHKIRALNTIINVALCCTGCCWLEIDQWYASALNVGSGLTRYNCNLLPIPTPTTLELLGLRTPIFARGPQRELLTPTCAALLKTLTVNYDPCPPLCISRIGYGGGRMEYDTLPNFLRLCVGYVSDKTAQSATDSLIIFESEIENPTDEILHYLNKKLRKLKARTVYTLPVTSFLNPRVIKLIVSSTIEQSKEIKQFLIQNLPSHQLHWRKEFLENLITQHECVNTPWGFTKLEIKKLSNNDIISITPDDNKSKKISKQFNLPYEQICETIKSIYLMRNKE